MSLPSQQVLKNHVREKVFVVDDQDKMLWELVSTVPYVSTTVAIISALLNCFIPGFGTTLAACMADNVVSKTQLVVGLFQFLTSWLIIGWVASIYWGYLLVIKATGRDRAPVIRRGNSKNQLRAPPSLY